MLKQKTKYNKNSQYNYPAAIASKLAGTAAVNINLGWPELFASPSKAVLNSRNKLT